MKLVLRFENLDVKRAIGSKVFGGPGPQYSLMVLEEKEEQKEFFFNYDAGVESFVKAIWILWNMKFARLTRKSAASCNKTSTCAVHR